MFSHDVLYSLMCCAVWFGLLIFLFYCAMQVMQSAVLSSYVVCPSVRPCVCPSLKAQRINLNDDKITLSAAELYPRDPSTSVCYSFADDRVILSLVKFIL